MIPLAIPPRFRLLAPTLAVLLAAPAAQAETLYHLTVITAPDGGDVSVTDLNDAGQVVGMYLDADFNGRAAVWDADGTVHPLGVPGQGDIQAYAINNHGQVVGSFSDYVAPAAGLLWDAAAPSQWTRLHDDPDVNVGPLDINDDGIVVGGFGLPAQSRAFVWTAEGGLVDYGVEDESVPFQQARWLAVNASGRLVGHYNVHSSTIHAIGGQAGTAGVGTLGPMSAEFASVATAINDAGTVVGLGLAEDRPKLVPVVFGADGSFREIPGAVFDLENGCASAINGAGVIVGNAGIGSASGCVPGGKAWIYRDGEARDLFELVDDAGPFTHFAAAVAINADGVIVGTGRDADDRLRSFRLTPIAADGLFADGFDG